MKKINADKTREIADIKKRKGADKMKKDDDGQKRNGKKRWPNRDMKKNLHDECFGRRSWLRCFMARRRIQM